MDIDELVKRLRTRPTGDPHLHAMVHEAATALETLRAELEEARKDAERYRVLRGDSNHNGFHLNGSLHIGNFEVTQKTEPGIAMYWHGKKLDEAIDAARQQQGNAP